MNDDYEITTAAPDTTVFFIDSTQKTIYDFLDGVDIVLSRVRDGDDDVAVDTLRSMTAMGHAIGISKAKLLHGWKAIWLDSGRDEDRFYEYVIEFGVLKSRTIIDRYIQAWEAYLLAPADFCEQVLLQPMKNLNALGAAVAQGYTPSKDEWEDLMNAPSNGEFLDVIRGMKGKEPRKNSLTIYLEENGDLVAWQDGKTTNLGYLDLDEYPEIRKKAIERIVKGAGIIKR